MTARRDGEVITMLAVTPLGHFFDVAAASQEHVLTVLREAIGGDRVDVVALPDDLDMWIDDEGLFEARPQANLFASAVAIALGMKSPHPHMVPTWAGTVVFAGVRNGATVSISTEAREFITGLVEAVRPF